VSQGGPLVDAIEYAVELRTKKVVLYEVTKPDRHKGIQLFKNAEGISLSSDVRPAHGGTRAR
jgi:hypothetical protein